MGITDVIRGDDHLSNTPKQLLVLEALGADAAALRAPAAAARARRQEALQAPRRRLGPGAARRPATCRPRCATTSPCSAGAPTTTRRSSRPPELIEQFSIERVGRSSAIFDERKLRWLNGRYMRELPLDEYVEAAAARARARRPRGGAPPTASGSRARLRDRPGEGADADRALAADPLPVRAAGRRPEGVVEGDGARRRRRRARRGARGPARRPSRSTRRRSRRRSAPWSSGWARSRATSTSRCGSRSRARRSRRGSSNRSPCSVASESLERVEAALSRLRAGRAPEPSTG